MSAKAATGVGTSFDCRKYQNVVIAVSAAVNSSLTFKFQGSIGSGVGAGGDSPEFGTAQAGDNHWDYVGFTDLQTAGTLVAGDTGVTVNNDTVVNNTHLYMLNTQGLSFVNMDLTAYTDGDLSAFVVGFTY